MLHVHDCYVGFSTQDIALILVFAVLLESTVLRNQNVAQRSAGSRRRRLHQLGLGMGNIILQT